MSTIKVKLLTENAKMPIRGTTASAGIDLYCSQGAMISPNGQTHKVHTDVAIEIPPGYYGQIECRSSFAVKHALVTGGVIDSDYRGPLTVLLQNHGQDTLHIKQGERCAQLLILPVPTFPLVEVSTLTETGRGSGGFGSTGKN